ncbi:5059_t:CDS:1 [Scutellospora calospora]|uniref:5059_t:CDS:1 n=1 Tax=Scutellospora calospora TaxID=85575 RepID=A0ACA9KBY7_9GLOM|nr:5059_t:CDS:1 [Scutellospora calospora]
MSEKNFFDVQKEENEKILEDDKKKVSKLSLEELQNKIEQDLINMNKETRNDILNINQKEDKYFEIENNENKQYLRLEDNEKLEKYHSFTLFVGNGYLTFNFVKRDFLKMEIRRICEFVELEETHIYEEIIKFDEIDDENLSYFFDFENNINIRPFTIDKNDKKSMIFHCDIKKFTIYYKNNIVYNNDDFMSLFK